VGTLSNLRRLVLRDKVSIRQASRQLGISRNTATRWLQEPEMVEPIYPTRQPLPGVLDAFKEQLSTWLKADSYRNKRDRRGQIPNRRPLSERPLHIEARRQVGHWECDTVMGANHKGAVVTIVERKSGYAVMAKVSNKTSELVSSAIVDKLQPLAARVKTLTFDNGKEFARHAYIDEQLQNTAYFARPFASWERGSNENLNGLLRQYVPKKRAMSTVTDEEIRMIQNRLNNRPRKRLGFKTPAEVFHQSLKRVALRA